MPQYDMVYVKQKTAYEMRISDWSSDVCSSDLGAWPGLRRARFPPWRPDKPWRSVPAPGDRRCARMFYQASQCAAAEVSAPEPRGWGRAIQISEISTTNSMADI